MLDLRNSVGIPSISAALPEGIDLMAETISELLGGVCGMLLAGEIVYVISAKGGTSLDTT